MPEEEVKEEQVNTVKIGANGDIIGKYNIPVRKQAPDHQLELPEEMDSSDETSGDELKDSSAH